MKSFKTTTLSLPAYWPSALINDDNEGLNKWDEEKMKDLFSNNPDLGACISCSDESYFSMYRGMGCDMLDYTFIIK